MKKILKKLNIVCVFALVVSTLMLFSTNAFAYSGTGASDNPYQISTFVSGELLPDDYNYYINDFSFGVYLYTDDEAADLYFCKDDVAPLAYAHLCWLVNPGETVSWITYNNQFGEHPVIRLFVCDHNSVTAVNAVAPSCTEDGIKAHYHCQDCDLFFSDEACTTGLHEEDTIDPATGHSIKTVAEKNASCTEDGIKAHYHCTACGKLFSDEAGTTEVTEDKLVIPATGHVSKVIPGKAATYDATGLTDGEVCEKCGTVLVEQEEIPKLEKNADPEKKPEKESPDTSDVSVLYICLAFALVSTASASFMLKRKHSM